jgi:hypothetical protein
MDLRGMRDVRSSDSASNTLKRVERTSPNPSPLLKGFQATTCCVGGYMALNIFDEVRQFGNRTSQLPDSTLRGIHGPVEG